jgi:hypothetical protein
MALVAGALASFIWFYELEGEAGREGASRSAAKVFPELAASDIEWLEFTTAEGVMVRAERSEGRWTIVAPRVFPADAVTLDAMAGALADLAREQRVDVGQPLEIYGLGESERRVRFWAAGREHTLRVGDRTPLGSNTYVATADGGGASAVPTWRINALSKPLLDVRDRRVLPFDESSVARIDLRWPGGAPVSIVRDVERWRLVAPVEAPADSARVDQLLSDLAYLRAEGFVDEPLSSQDSGLDPPDFEVALTLGSAPAGEGGRVVRFALGRVDAAGQRLARGRHKTLYVLGEGQLEDFPRDLNAYRARRVAGFVPAEAVRVEVSFSREGTEEPPGGASEPFALVRRDGAWTSRPALRNGRAEDWLTTLSNLQAIVVLAESVGADERAGLGLRPPRARFRVLGRSPEGEGRARVLAEVWIGKVDPARGVIAMRPDREEVFALAPTLLDHLPVNYTSFEEQLEGAGAGVDDASRDQSRSGT